MKTILVTLAILLLVVPAYAGDDDPGVNFKFNHLDGTGTKSSSSYNPQIGWSYTFDSGNTRKADGS